MLTSRSVHATPNRLDVGAPGLDGAVRFVHAGRRVRRRLLQRAARPGDAVGGHPRVSNTCVNPAGLGEDAGFGGDGPPADAPHGGRGALAAVLRGARRGRRGGPGAGAGGTVRTEAVDVPDVGRVAEPADPYGARFAVIRSPEPQD
ncbi:hypothetical protein GCM10020295_12520 [Streptomyces cinereospinus]